MSIINIGKRIGDMDIRLGIPPSKPQFSVAETNRRFSVNNVSSNYNSVFNQFRSGLTQVVGWQNLRSFYVRLTDHKVKHYYVIMFMLILQVVKNCC